MYYKWAILREYFTFDHLSTFGFYIWKDIFRRWYFERSEYFSPPRGAIAWYRLENTAVTTASTATAAPTRTNPAKSTGRRWPLLGGSHFATFCCCPFLFFVLLERKDVTAAVLPASPPRRTQPSVHSLPFARSLLNRSSCCLQNWERLSADNHNPPGSFFMFPVLLFNSRWLSVRFFYFWQRSIVVCDSFVFPAPRMLCVVCFSCR